MTAQRHHSWTPAPGTAVDGAIPAPRDALDADPMLRLELDYPEPGTARLRVHGEVDLTNTDRLGELIRSRLRTELQVVVLDLSGLGFLSVSGAVMLTEAAAFATEQGTELRILSGESHAVRCVMRVTGLDQYLPPHPR